MLKSALFYSAALVAVSSPAFAQTALQRENVVVTATRVATPAEDIGSSVTVISADIFEARQLRSLPDILRNVPGLSLVKAGGQGGQTSLFTRGSNSNHTKILVDGIDIADPSTPNGAYDLGKFSAADIARVEVLRGPSSGLYGSDAIGGVVHVITKAGEGDPTVTARLEVGSYATFNQDVSLSGSNDALHYRITAAHAHAGDTDVTPASVLPPGQKARGDFYDNLSISAKLGYDVSENFDIGFVGRTSSILNKVTNDGFSFVTFMGVPSAIQTRIAGVQNDARATAHLVLGRIDSTFGVSYSSVVTAIADPDNGNSRNSGDRIKWDWQGFADMGYGQVLVAGAETSRDAIHAPVSAGTTTNAGFVELQSAVGFFNNALSIRFDDNSRFGSKFTYRIAPSIRLDATATRIKASFGTGFKAPSLQQLFGAFGSNPNLKPETSTGYDIGLDQTLGEQVTAGATWFHNDIKNLIDFGPAPTFLPLNIGKARTQGVEAYLGWTPLQTVSLRADYTYTDARDRRFGTQLLRRPATKVSGAVTWQALPDLSLNASITHEGAGTDVDRLGFFNVPTQSYVRGDISANYILSGMFTLFGRVDNLSDEDYQKPSGFLQPGRSFYAGIKATF